MPNQNDSAFWKRFAKTYWEKKSLVLREVPAAIRKIDEKQVFRALVQLSNLCRKRNDPQGFKLFLDGVRQHDEDVLQFLPEKKDRTFLGYHERMNQYYPDYCLVCDELLQVPFAGTSALQKFTQQLYSEVGFPNRFAEVGLYLGNYKKTPFGVHVDQCGVFSFPLVGQKRFRLWKSSFVKKNPKLDRSFRYAQYKKDSELLVAEPGDMTYWPSSAYHIAESTGEFSATWSLGVWVDRPHSEFFLDSLNLYLTSKLNSEALTKLKMVKLKSGKDGELPEQFVDSIKVLKGLSTEDLLEHYLKVWRVHVAHKGLKPNPIKANSRSK